MITKATHPSFGQPPFIHSVQLERAFFDTLGATISFAARHLSLNTPWQVELGIVGTPGLPLYVVGIDRHLYGRPILKSEIFHRGTLRSPDLDASNKLLLDFFSKIHDATGTARPTGYCGFPPNRPAP